MQVHETGFKDLFLIEPRVFQDERGYFFESFNQETFEKLTGLSINFVQDNESLSNKNVIRGLHFQKPPFAQDKLIRVIKGSVLDVVVDLRKNQSTYGKVFEIILSETNKKQLFVPKGFAHGFKTLENNTIFYYKCSNFYNKESEGGILWADENLNINWNVENPIISEKDRLALPLDKFESPF
ncbi:MAG: dTDP-4-dehydrorhamnose 3,5-epimerase [Luteibaculaceae bacterium]